MKKTFMAAIAVGVLLAIIIIILFSSLVFGKSLSYGGTTSPGNTTPPEVKFSQNGTVLYNGSTLYSSGNIRLDAGVGRSEAFQFILYTVSYKGSWEDRPIVIYQTTHNPTNIDNNSDCFVNQIYYLNLTDIPNGPQQIAVTCIEGGYYVDWESDIYYTFSMNSTSSFDFTVVEEQEPEPFPTALVIASIITVVVFGIGLFVYFKKRKR